MTEQEYDIIMRFRKIHEGHDGMIALADQLMDLGFLSIVQSEEQQTLRNYAIRVIERMGVMRDGDKYQLCLSIAKVLQNYIPDVEVESGR